MRTDERGRKREREIEKNRERDRGQTGEHSKREGKIYESREGM